MRAACIQLCSGVDIAPNIETTSKLIRDAAAQGATFIATPEMTHIVQRSARKLFETIVPEGEDKGVARFGDLAKELGVTLLIGSLAIRSGEDRAVNRSYVFGPQGDILARYDKIHLFDVTVSKAETWTESRVYDRGDKAVMIDIDEARIGLSICYDLRFPHLYRAYAQEGANIICVPAAFTRPTGEAHWETLLKARAIETGAYIIAPAQGGQHADGRVTWGHSMMINPWGEIEGCLDHDRPGFVCADLDLQAVTSARTKVPAWQHDPEFTL